MPSGTVALVGTVLVGMAVLGMTFPDRHGAVRHGISQFGFSQIGFSQFGISLITSCSPACHYSTRRDSVSFMRLFVFAIDAKCSKSGILRQESRESRRDR